MPPKKKIKSSLANCWQPSTCASNLPPSTATTSTPTSSDSEPENRDSESNPQIRKRVGSSYIWDHGSKVVCSNGSPGWKCIYCHHVLPSVSSTSNQRRHLRKVHKIKDPGDHDAK